MFGRLQLGSPQPLSVGYSPASAQTPTVLHANTVPTYHSWLSCGVMASEEPPPATPCRHTGQMYCSGTATRLSVQAFFTSRVNYAQATPRKAKRRRFVTRVFETAATSDCQSVVRSSVLPTLPRRHSVRGGYLGQTHAPRENARAVSVAHVNPRAANFLAQLYSLTEINA